MTTVVATATMSALGLAMDSTPDLVGVLRTVMKVLGGFVVVALVLIVFVAIVSGVIGMAGRLKKRS
jgi:hypothetical protein